MNIALFCFSNAGAKLAEKLCRLLDIEKTCVHSIDKFASVYGFTSHKRVGADVGTLFNENDALIFISACGIAVREIAPYVKSKTTDPAVVVIDDQGKFVIPVLSGHIGGANDLAREIAEKISAVPVVTTSTDGAGKFSCDSWAAKHDCAISSMETAKEISAAILTKDIPICSDYELPKRLPQGLVKGEQGDLGIYIGICEKSPFKTTLRLIPRTLTLGIGCRRGTEKERFDEVTKAIFQDHGLDIRAVKTVASIDVKKEEKGLLQFAEALHADTVFYTADELNAVEGDFEESEFVKRTVGTGNVCERAAACDGGNVIVKKTAMSGVTAAVSEKVWRIEF